MFNVLQAWQLAVVLALTRSQSFLPLVIGHGGGVLHERFGHENDSFWTSKGSQAERYMFLYTALIFLTCLPMQAGNINNWLVSLYVAQISWTFHVGWLSTFSWGFHLAGLAGKFLRELTSFLGGDAWSKCHARSLFWILYIYMHCTNLHTCNIHPTHVTCGFIYMKSHGWVCFAGAACGGVFCWARKCVANL